jgi:signal transduction histidine kinase
MADRHEAVKQLETAELRLEARVPWLRLSADRHELPILGGLLTAVGYYLGVEAGSNFTLAPQPVSTLWPPNAILFGALLLAPARHWWIFLLAVLPVHLSAQLSNGVALSMSLLWFVSNVSEALIGAVAVRHYVRGPLLLDSSRQITVFLVCSVLATFLSTFLDTGFVALMDTAASLDYWTVWRTRFFSNVLAMVTVTPVVVTLGAIDLEELKRVPLRRYIEFTLLTIVLIVASFVVFNRHPHSSATFVLLYLLTPPLLWAALRFDARIVSPLLLAVSVIAIDAAVKGHGPFEAGSLLDNALAVQIFLLTAAVPILALVAVTRERSRAQELARGNEERLNLALGAAQMGTLDWDLTSDRVTLCNTSRQMLGVPDAPQVVPMKFYLALAHPDDRAMLRETLAEARSRRSTYNVEFRRPYPSGMRWIAAKGKVLTDEHGKDVRVLGVNIDVTERKSIEKQEQEHRQQLAHLSRVAVMGELSGALAHEINQPLASIMSNAEAGVLMIDGGSADIRELKDIYSDIVSESHRASEVIRHMRNFLKKGETRFQPLDINDTIREVLSLEYSDLTARGISLQTDLEPDVPFVYADRVQLQQILLNLIANARDAMAGNSVSERVLTVSSKRGAGNTVELRISDLGDGIPEHQRGDIFQPFFSTKQQGLGMGLAICRTIINTHSGQLWVSENSPRGSTFHVLLPCVPPGINANDVASSTLEPREVNDLLSAARAATRQTEGSASDGARQAR